MNLCPATSVDGVPFAEKRIRILEQNIKQFIRVLQQMFPNTSFDANVQADACADNGHDGRRLACLWSRIQALDHEDEIQDKDAKYAALHMVCPLLLNPTLQKWDN